MKVAWLLCVLGATGCEYVVNIEGKVAIESSVAPPAGTKLWVIATSFRDPMPAWDPRGLAPAQDVVENRYFIGKIGGFEHALYLAAFADLDGDGVLGPGEPFGAFAGNPILDAPGGSFDVDSTIADIAIAMRAP